MSRLGTGQLVINAQKAGKVVPAFNIPHLPMMKPVVQALRQTNTFGLIQVARQQCNHVRRSLKESPLYDSQKAPRLHHPAPAAPVATGS